MIQAAMGKRKKKKKKNGEESRIWGKRRTITTIQAAEDRSLD